MMRATVLAGLLLVMIGCSGQSAEDAQYNDPKANQGGNSQPIGSLGSAAGDGGGNAPAVGGTPAKEGTGF